MSDEKNVELNNPLLSIIKKVLNTFNSTKTISKQECVLEIARLPLTVCSDEIVEIRANGYYKVQTQDEQSKTSFLQENWLTKYAKRNKNFWHLSFAQYFYMHNISKETNEPKVLHVTGLNGTPTYPITAGYAKTCLIMYKPWSECKNLSIYSDHQAIAQFNSFLQSGQCPRTVKDRYEIARNNYLNSRHINEVTVDNDSDFDTDGFPDESDDVSLDAGAYKTLTSFQHNSKVNLHTHGLDFNIGQTFDWHSNNRVSPNLPPWLESCTLCNFPVPVYIMNMTVCSLL